MNSTDLRRIISAAVAELGDENQKCVLIREGYFGDRHSRFESVRAIWLTEEEYVGKLHGDDGKLLH